ncbi:unnamed protein product [Merluccius merluccius]
MTEGHSKASMSSFVGYARSFGEIQSLLAYELEKPKAQATSEDDQLIGFGSRSKITWREVWDRRADGYAAFIMRTNCAFCSCSSTDTQTSPSYTCHTTNSLPDCLIDEYRRQEPAITKLLQGTFGQSEAVKSLQPMYQGLARRYSNGGVEKANYHWVDRDCCVAFRIPDLHHGEHFNWDAWRTTPSILTEATAGTLENTCASRTHYNSNIVVKLDLFHCMRRFTRECTSEHHPLYSTFCHLLSAAFSVVDQEDLQKLKDAYQFCGIQPPTPTKLHIG